jgi:hypothetical protein
MILRPIVDVGSRGTRAAVSAKFTVIQELRTPKPKSVESKNSASLPRKLATEPIAF